MRIIEYNREKAHQALERWRDEKELVELNQDYANIRAELLKLYNEAKCKTVDGNRKEYVTDVLFGMGLYDFFDNQQWFNLRTASNDGFWRYVATAVIPDLVAERWGENNDNYFWKQPNRLWPKSIWWYVFLAWNNSIDDTKSVLLSNNLNSDTIQGVVERTGRKGTYVEVYREILFRYSQLDNNVILKFKKQMSQGSDSLFRAIMRLNTARCLVIDPCLTENGVKGYVDFMINELTQNLN